MKLVIIAPENVYEQDVDPSMEIRDVLALIEALTDVPQQDLTVSDDSGVPMTSLERTLESYGVKGEVGTIQVTFMPVASTSASAAAAGGAGSSTAGMGAGGPMDFDDMERMRLQALGDERLMAQLKQASPAFANAIERGGSAFREMMSKQQQEHRDTMAEKQRQIEILNADPYDVEAQRKIEETIRMEAVLENMQHAMEYSPEAFGHVTMLYINVEVNGHPVKAFVDSGAQTTIISPECAEACGIMRLLDKRFAGVATGVGTANILGRIHSAQIKLGDLFLPVAFSVLEGRSVDLLFGLDMLKRHQACIDLSTNTLRIGASEIPFLPEHELPNSAHRMQEVAGEMGDAAAQGRLAGVASPKAPMREFPGAGNTLGGGPVGGSSAGRTAPAAAGAGPSGASAAHATPFKQADVDALVNLGATPAHAVELLRAAGGNVDVAASMLFG